MSEGYLHLAWTSRVHPNTRFIPIITEREQSCGNGNVLKGVFCPQGVVYPWYQIPSMGRVYSRGRGIG